MSLILLENKVSELWGEVQGRFCFVSRAEVVPYFGANLLKFKQLLGNKALKLYLALEELQCLLIDKLKPTLYI